MKPIITTRALICAVIACATLATTRPARADYASTVMSMNPVMYYHLNETAPVPIADQAVNLGTLGAAVNAFYSGTVNVNYFHPTPGALAGSSDGAATFSGLAGTLIVPYAASLNPTAFTAEAWLSVLDLDGTIAGPTHCA